MCTAFKKLTETRVRAWAVDTKGVFLAGRIVGDAFVQVVAAKLSVHHPTLAAGQAAFGSGLRASVFTRCVTR